MFCHTSPASQACSMWGWSLPLWFSLSVLSSKNWFKSGLAYLDYLENGALPFKKDCYYSYFFMQFCFVIILLARIFRCVQNCFLGVLMQPVGDLVKFLIWRQNRIRTSLPLTLLFFLNSLPVRLLFVFFGHAYISSIKTNNCFWHTCHGHRLTRQD